MQVISLVLKDRSIINRRIKMLENLQVVATLSTFISIKMLLQILKSI